MKLLFTALLALVFTTIADAQVLYHQDFENGFQDMSLIDNDGNTPVAQLFSFTAPWNVRGDLLGNAAVSISWYDPEGQSDDWMITPAISGITGQTILEWDARSFEASTPERYKVMVSVTGTDIADFTEEIFQVNGELAGGVFHHHFVLLDDYAGQNIHIAFVNISNNQYMLAVDNIQVREVFAVDAALLDVQVDTYVRTGLPNAIRYTVRNNGFQPIDSLVFNWSDGVHNYSETLTGLGLDFGEDYEGVFADAFTATGPNEYPLTFNIVNVGSQPDELTGNNSVSTFSAGVSAVVPRRVVGEEATGTWCGWCPRGTVYMDRMYHDYPDMFIPIAVHDSDPMTNHEYNHAFTLFFDYPAYPTVAMDRKIIVDPVDLDSSIQVLLQAVTPVDVTVRTSLDSLDNTLYIEGEITTYTQRTNAKYQLVLVLVENDVRGTSNGYRQTNYYAGGIHGPMGGYENLPNPVPASQMRYDYVARQLPHDFQGLSGLVSAAFQENDIFQYNTSLVLPPAYDTDQLYVVAMVTDSVSGVVLNAAKSALFTSAVKDEIRELKSLNIYPNPAQGSTRLDLELTESARVTIEILNQTGQSVRTQDFGKLPAGESVLPVQVAGLSAGVYVVKVNVAGKLLLRRLVVG